MTTKLMQVIFSDEVRHGSGKDRSSPVRRVVQYWSTDGDLLAEVDPMSSTVPIEDEHRRTAEVSDLKEKLVAMTTYRDNALKHIEALTEERDAAKEVALKLVKKVRRQ